MPLILSLLPLALLAFWAWMFSDMLKKDALPQCFATFSAGRDLRFDWIVAFIFLNVFAAMYYYPLTVRASHQRLALCFRNFQPLDL